LTARKEHKGSRRDAKIRTKRESIASGSTLLMCLWIATYLL